MKKTKEKMQQPSKEEQLAFNLKDVRERRIPDVVIKYNIGDEVIHGCVKKSVVKDIIDNGKILLDQICTQENYGNPYDYERQMYVPWYDVCLKGIQSEEIHTPSYMQLNYSQRQIDSLLNTYYHFGIDLNPPYQRDLVWELSDKIKLLDSIFSNVDIGKFVLNHKPYDTNDPDLYEIIDGKQRLSTLVEYTEGRFRWRGKTFQELHIRDQNHLCGYSISYAELREPTKADVLRTFIRLNTSGKPMDPNHMKYVTQLAEAAEYNQRRGK